MNPFQIFIFLILLHINIVQGETENIDKIVAFVNNNIILHSDVLKKIHLLHNKNLIFNHSSLQNKDLYNNILNQLIINNLINQIAKQEHINISRDQLNNIIQDIASSRKMTKNQFLTYLNNYNIEHEQYYTEIQQEILNKIIYTQSVHQHIQFSNQELEQTIPKINYIDFNKKFQLTHIIIDLPIQPLSYQINDANNLANFLIQERKSKKNFQNTIQKYYQSNIFPKITIQEKKWISWNNIPIIFDQYLQTAKSGDIIGPIQAYDGIHILEIKDISFEQYIFPITRIKINSVYTKNINQDKNIKQQLLEIKKQLENHQTTFNILSQKKSSNLYVEYSTWIDLNDFNKSLQESLISLKKNQISMPIYTKNGWCIIQLTDTIKLNYSEIIRERAYLYLLNQKLQNTVNKWIQELKSKSYIKVIHPYALQ